MAGHLEEGVRRHSGIVSIVQTVIGGILLLLAGGIYNSLGKSTESIQGQATDIAVIKSQMQTMNTLVGQNQARTDAQISTLTAISTTLVRLDTKMNEDEAKIEELRKTSRLK